MSADKRAHDLKILELATSLVNSFLSAQKAETSNEQSSKSEQKTVTLSEEQVLSFLQVTVTKMNELAPFQVNKIGLGQ